MRDGRKVENERRIGENMNKSDEVHEGNEGIIMNETNEINAIR